MEEDDGVPGREEVLRRGGAPRPGGEIVDEAHGLVFEGDGGAAGGDEHDAPVEGEVLGDEVGGEGGVGVEGLGWGVAVEVVGVWVWWGRGLVSCCSGGGSGRSIG